CHVPGGGCLCDRVLVELLAAGSDGCVSYVDDGGGGSADCGVARYRLPQRTPARRHVRWRSLRPRGGRDCPGRRRTRESKSAAGNGHSYTAARSRQPAVVTITSSPRRVRTLRLAR